MTVDFLARVRGLFRRLFFISSKQMATLTRPALTQSAASTQTVVHAVLKGLGQQYYSITAPASEIKRLQLDPVAVQAMADATRREEIRALDAHYEELRMRNPQGGQWWPLYLSTGGNRGSLA